MGHSRDYMLRRQSQSRSMAKNATSQMARIVHEKLALEYASWLQADRDERAFAYEAKAFAKPLQDKLRKP